MELPARDGHRVRTESAQQNGFQAIVSLRPVITCSVLLSLQLLLAAADSLRPDSNSLGRESLQMAALTRMEELKPGQGSQFPGDCQLADSRWPVKE
jgi:hypothetical protein